MGAVSYLPYSYDIDNVIAKAVTEIETLKQRSAQTVLRFAKPLKDKTLRCANAFCEQRTKSVFGEGQPLNGRENIRMYRVARPVVNLRQPAQYADALMQLGDNTFSLSTRATSPKSNRRGGLSGYYQNQEQEGFCAQQDRVHVPVTTVKIPSAIGMKNIGTDLQKTLIKWHLQLFQR